MASPAISSSSAFLIILPFFFSSFQFSFSADKTAAAAEIVSREFFPMEADLAWVIQVSDLHLSAYHPKRAEDLARLLGLAMRVIRPDLLLITGDITDAKNRKRTSTRQDESEWIQYRNTVDKLVKQTGFEMRRIFDIRGNHDKYGVPYVGSALDFFSIYSVSSQFNRLSTIQSISLVGDDQRYIFLGIDDTMRIGIRGPSNLFGHPTDNRIRAVEAELQYWDDHPAPFVTKIVFGHFPLSFTASAEKGERYEPIFARNSISAYICGHLHSKFGKQLWRLHRSTVKQFWEWELGDWKDSRLIRILAIDRGDVSFLDIEFRSISEPPSGFETSILITYPTDSRSMSGVKERTQLVRNDINALVFSARLILNATATIYDSSRDFVIVEEIPLRPANGKPLYHAKWNAESYVSLHPARYWLQVHVIDSHGNRTASMPRPFSVEGNKAEFSPSWLASLVFELQWEQIFPVLQWSNISFLILLLCLPKLLNPFMEAASMSAWLWFLIEGSGIKKLWCAMAIYLAYLLTMPWFWGHAASERGKVFKLCLSGWRMQSFSGAASSERLGFPDLMTITLPFMYFVVTPLFLLIYSFSAERSAACSHMKKHLDAENKRKLSGCKICAGWLRKALLFASAVIACLHLKLASGIMEAYGTAPVALSPAVSWVPSLLLAAAIYSTTNKA